MKSLQKSRSIAFIVLIGLMVTLELPAQSPHYLTVLDRATEEPIVGLMYHCGNQKGITGVDGRIPVVLSGHSLHLSHINYGKWRLEGEELSSVLAEGVFYRQEQPVELQPVSIISLKLQEEKDKKISISDQERIHHDAGAVLNLDPVISSIRKSGAFGFDPVMRGFKYDQLNIVVDGLQTANAACPNRMDPPTSQIVLNRVKQVEILKGPHALRYGIGLGGTINFIQESPRFSESPSLHGRVSSMYESNGQVIRNEGRIGVSSERYDVGIMGSWSSGTDYKDGDGNVVPANFMRGAIGVYGDFSAGKGNLIQVNVNRNFARNVDFPTLGMDLRKDDTWMGSIRHTRSFSARNLRNWSNLAFFTVVDHLMDNKLRQIDPRMMDAVTPAHTQNGGFRTEGEWKLGHAKLFVGADLRSESAKGTRQRTFLMGPNKGTTVYENAWQDARIIKAGIFQSIQWPIGSYMVNLAGRIDVNRAESFDQAAEFVKVNPEHAITQINPGISLGVKKDLNDQLYAGLWMARVSRSGSLTERFINSFPVGVDPYEMLGNPGILPETNNQLDWVIGYTKGDLNVEFTMFGAYLQNYITAEVTELAPRMASAPGVRQFVNVDKALKTGFEISARQRLGEYFSHQFTAGYTYGQNLVEGEALPEIAPMDTRYSIFGDFLDGRLHTRAALRYVLAQRRVSERFSERSTPGFTLLDADATYAFTPQISLKGGVQNLLNQSYYEHLNRSIGADRVPLFAPGRNVFVMVSVRF